MDEIEAHQGTSGQKSYLDYATDVIVGADGGDRNQKSEIAAQLSHQANRLVIELLAAENSLDKEALTQKYGTEAATMILMAQKAGISIPTISHIVIAHQATQHFRSEGSQANIDYHAAHQNTLQKVENGQLTPVEALNILGLIGATQSREKISTQWAIYGRTYYPEEEALLKYLKGAEPKHHALNALEAYIIENAPPQGAIVIDLMSGIQWIRNTKHRTGDHMHIGIAVGIEPDMRSFEEKESDDQQKVYYLQGDVNDNETFNSIRAITGQNRAELIMSSPAGGIENVLKGDTKITRAQKAGKILFNIMQLTNPGCIAVVPEMLITTADLPPPNTIIEQIHIGTRDSERTIGVIKKV